MSTDNNKRMAGILRQIAALLDEQGVAFKPNAYRKAAIVVEELSKDISTFKTEKELMELPGIGEAIASKIREFVSTGHVSFLEKLMAEQGELSFELMQIEDLGPKRVRVLQKELGVETVADLIKAAQAGKLRDLPRFSDIIEKKILENAKNVTERSKRFPREEVKDDVELILKTLKKVPKIERVAVAGSYRREKETIGDIDIIVITDSADTVMDAIAKLPIVDKVVAKGDTKISFNLKSLLRVDVRLVKNSEWGSAILYFTGDKEHNISLRKRAIKKGWKLNEYALLEGEKIIASKEEEDIYKALDLPYIEPNKRTSVLPA